MNNPIKKILITLDDCFDYYFRTVSEDYMCSKCNKFSSTQTEKKNI